MSNTLAYSKIESDNRFASKSQLKELEGLVDNISVSGGKIYETLLLANDDLANIEQNERIEIYGDSIEENNGIWTKNESNILVFVRKIDEIVNSLFESNLVDNGVIQTTATGDSNTSVTGGIHGLSVAIGVVPNPFNKIIFYYAQSLATPITQVEVRLFKGKTVGGELIVKKRISFSAVATVQAFVEIPLDDIISYDGDMWWQVLVNNPFAYKKVTPAVLRTAALGYGQPRVTTVNNLDGTTFASTQPYCDARLDFNTIAQEIVPTDEGNEVILSSSTELVDIDITGNYVLPNSYMTSTGELFESANWRTSELIPVISGNYYIYSGRTSQTALASCMVGFDEDDVTTVILGNGDYSVTPIKVQIPNGVTYVRVCGFHLTPPLLFSQELKLKESLLPIGSSPESPDDKLKIDLTWNCVGHSIWWQDGNVFNGTSDLAFGIQSLVKDVFKFSKYNKYCYSGNSLGALVAGESPSITSKFSTWVDNSVGFWTLDTITNDFKRNIPIGILSDYTNATGVTTYYGALRSFKDKVDSLTLVDNNPIVIASNALKRNNDGYTSTSTNTVGAKLSDYEFALMQVCQINGWIFIDQFRKSEIEDDTLIITTTDGLHLNNFGYNLVSKLWINNFWILYRNSKLL